jgi:hypothetical protein
VGGDADDAHAFTSLQMSNVKPGDVKYAPLTIANTGTLGLTYTMATLATNPDSKGLRDALTLEGRLVASEAACDSSGTGFNASITTVIPAGSLSAAAISSRTLGSGTAEVICFKAALPSAAGDTLQGSSTVATFAFSATQA